MSDTDIHADEPDVESRRKFLKVSVAAGATVAAVAAGVHFMPQLASAAQSKVHAMKVSEGDAVASLVPATSYGDALVLVVEGDRVSLYKGEDKYVTNDASFAKQLSSSVKERL
jgi:secreted PhoX family phosphatase